MIFMLDNYDSFTYNLVQYLRKLDREVIVKRNDQTTIEEIKALSPEGIVISPGPGNPDSAGISLKVVKHFAGKAAILGVCLGHQAIAQAFGGKIVRAKRIMHGKTSEITTDSQGVFESFKKPFQAMRYHSLVAERETLPEVFTVSAQSDDGEIMGIRHKEFAIEGIQFHPESIMTPLGMKILRNYLKIIDTQKA
jgi:anthranilate synthase component II